MDTKDKIKSRKNLGAMIEIKTERLFLKKFSATDKNSLIALIGDSRVSETLSNVPFPYTSEDADYWLDSVKKNELRLSIRLNDALIGGIGLTHGDDGYCELGYWLGREYWGRGYATEASNSLLNYVRENTSLRKFRANVYKENIASSKVLQKLGFKQTGEGEVFSLSEQANISCFKYEYGF